MSQTTNTNRGSRRGEAAAMNVIEAPSSGSPMGRRERSTTAIWRFRMGTWSHSSVQTGPARRLS